MKIPFKMKTTDCKTMAGFIALYSKMREGLLEDYKEVRKYCNKSKDSAKEFDKTFCTLMKKVQKRNEDLELKKNKMNQICNIGEIYEKFDNKEKNEYQNKYNKMNSCYSNMISKFSKIEDRDTLIAMEGIEAMNEYYSKGKMDEILRELDPNNLKNNT